jgi:hypothetical protein
MYKLKLNFNVTPGRSGILIAYGIAWAKRAAAPGRQYDEI